MNLEANKLYALKQCSVLILLSLVFLSACDSNQPPTITISEVYDQELQYPAHVLMINSRYVAAELYMNRLVAANSADFSEPLYIDKQNLGTKLTSPHFLSPFHGDGLLVSEGWGSGIVYIPDLDSRKYTRYRGPGNDRMKAPHGLCVSKDGWIYVADSLNSRLVRFRDMTGSDWQVFKDKERLIAYGRQMLCREDGIWLTNSYEKREGMNPGQGSNVLRITDFSSGNVEALANFPDTNATGLAVLGNRWLIVGLWSGKNRLFLVDLKGEHEARRIERPDGISGPPYGISIDEDNSKMYVSYIGDLHKKKNAGGLVIYSIQ